MSSNRVHTCSTSNRNQTEPIELPNIRGVQSQKQVYLMFIGCWSRGGNQPMRDEHVMTIGQSESPIGGTAEEKSSEDSLHGRRFF